jgi:hypothetical protein
VRYDKKGDSKKFTFSAVLKKNKTAVIKVSGHQEVDVRKSEYQAFCGVCH